MALADHRSTIINELGTRQLRHDLLNSLNVLIGMTRILLDTEMTPTQRTCVQACRNAAERLLEMANHLDRYGQQAANGIDGPTQLADLCSIAAARVDKPFDRDTLLAVIERLAPVRSPRILLVDDAPEISVLVRAFLNGTRSVLDVVGDGERAVAQATSQPYDLVMMDVDLPGLDGATAAHAIRAADLARGASPTPIVALSAVGGQSQRNVEGLDGNEPAALNDPERAALLPGFIANRRDAEPRRAGRLRARGIDWPEHAGRCPGSRRRCRQPRRRRYRASRASSRQGGPRRTALASRGVSLTRQGGAPPRVGLTTARAIGAVRTHIPSLSHTPPFSFTPSVRPRIETDGFFDTPLAN
jgi:CheY-like chemotaxis protein